MFFNVTLYIALIVFGIGSLYKISTWFRCKIGVAARVISPSERVSAAIKGIISTLFSGKILTILRVFLVDVVLQMKTLQEDGLRWLMHLCIYWGFMLLLLMHALDKFITSPLFPDYQPTVNPFLALRDIFSLPPIRLIVLSSSTRSNLACCDSGNSPSSSSNRVPP